MPRPIMIIAGAIPAIIALLIAIPLITQQEIPFSAAGPDDVINIEFTKHDLKKVTFGVTERIASQKSEILIIRDNGDVRYTVTDQGVPKPDIFNKIGEDKVHRLTALIKETGFMEIPSESFPVKDDTTEYQKSSLKITLNGAVKQINWPEQNATEKFVPPIITLVESELNQIITKISK